jgi:hypothetical protein
MQVLDQQSASKQSYPFWWVFHGQDLWVIFFDACFSFCPFGFCFRLSLKSRYAYGTPVFELVSFNSCPPNLQCRWLERAWVGAEGRGRSF